MLYVLAFAISGGVSFAAGKRDDALLMLTVLLQFPILAAMFVISVRLFPLEIALEREGWTPGDSESDRELADLFARLRNVDAVLGVEDPDAPPEVIEGTNDTGGRSPLSALPDPPVSLEGIVIALAFAVWFAYALYIAFEPQL